MKPTTPSTPDYTIKQVGNDCFKVFDRNQHFRRSFGTRAGCAGRIIDAAHRQECRRRSPPT